MSAVAAYELDGEPTTLEDLAEANSGDPEVEEWLAVARSLEPGQETHLETRVLRRVSSDLAPTLGRAFIERRAPTDAEVAAYLEFHVRRAAQSLMSVDAGSSRTDVWGALVDAKAILRLALEDLDRARSAPNEPDPAQPEKEEPSVGLHDVLNLTEVCS